MELRAEATTAAGVTFVTAVLENPTEAPISFRVASTLDGPVWPPRRNGHVERGWDENGYEGFLAPESRRPIGFATTGEPTDEPVALVRAERATADESRPDAASTIRRYRDPRPPRSVLSSLTLSDDDASPPGQSSPSTAGGSP